MICENVVLYKKESGRENNHLKHYPSVDTDTVSFKHMVRGLADCLFLTFKRKTRFSNYATIDSTSKNDVLR